MESSELLSSQNSLDIEASTSQQSLNSERFLSRPASFINPSTTNAEAEVDSHPKKNALVSTISTLELVDSNG